VERREGGGARVKLAETPLSDSEEVVELLGRPELGEEEGAEGKVRARAKASARPRNSGAEGAETLLLGLPR
jgi:hypothetical protein